VAWVTVQGEDSGTSEFLPETPYCGQYLQTVPRPSILHRLPALSKPKPPSKPHLRTGRPPRPPAAAVAAPAPTCSAHPRPATLAPVCAGGPVPWLALASRHRHGGGEPAEVAAQATYAVDGPPPPRRDAPPYVRRPGARVIGAGGPMSPDSP
jgi:hypothetical protein